MVEFTNDPIQLCIKAFNHLYPDKNLYIQYDVNLIQTNKSAYLADTDTYSVIGINPEMNIADIASELRQMMAHFIIGNMRTSKKWKAVYEKIGNIMVQLVNNGVKESCEVLKEAVERNDLN